MRKSRLFAIFGAFFLLLATLAAPAAAAPSARCHVTDGRVTICADGQLEWSDVPVLAFPETNSFLYADQADLDPLLNQPGSPADTLMLLYDECARLAPLGPDEYVLVSFKTVEVEDGVEKLEHYAIHLFSDGTLIFLENGVSERDSQGRLRTDSIEGQRGAVGFGSTPNCAADHVVAEFEIKLSATGIALDGGYSPDPIFWSSDPPEPKECPVKPLSPITDPQAQQLEAPETTSTIQVNGHPVRVSSRALLDGLTQDTRTRLDNFLEAVVGTEGAGTPTVSSAFRPQAYQDHLREIRDRANELGARVANGQVTFTNTAEECAQRRQEIADELLNHGLGNNPVARRSDHGTGNAVDITAPLPPGVDVDALARQAGLTRPLPVRDPVHFVNGGQGSQPGTIRGRSPIALLVTDPAGRRIGFDPVTRSIVNEIGPDASYSGLGSEPQVFEFEDMPDGDYVISGVGTGNGPYTLEVITTSNDSVLLGEAQSTGTAALRDVITPVRARISGEGDVAVEQLPRPPDPAPSLTLRPGFDANTLPPNDDGSTGLVPIGFGVNFFGTRYESVYVNNNGNITFDAPLSAFTPFDLTSTRRSIIAPFFADVDTRVGRTLTYGTGTVDGRPAFGVTWPGVGCFSGNTSVLNFFQVVLVDRSSAGDAAFDVEFNYDSIQWETGQASGGDAECGGGAAARVGFSNGTGQPGTFFELAGSGVPGSFLDSNPATGLAHRNLNSGLPGRYLFPVRAGVPTTDSDGDADGIADGIDNCPETSNVDQADRNQNGVGDTCEATRTPHASGAFLRADVDGGTAVEATPVAIDAEPPLVEQLGRIVAFRTAAGLTGSPEQLTRNLVASLVEAGAVAADAAEALVADVLLRVDRRPPAITITTPAEGASYVLGSSVTAGYTCQDEQGGSGVVQCAGPVPSGTSLDTSSVGTRTFTVSARDRAQNASTLTHTYQVRYDFTGFLAPVENPSTVNRVKAGSAVPLKFSLHGDQGLAVLAAGYPASRQVTCSDASPINELEPTVTPGDSSLSYDATEDTYTYVWKTDRAWADQCRLLTMRLGDGTEHTAVFWLT